MVDSARAMDLAQLNVGRLRAPVDSPVVAEFMDALDPISSEPAPNDDRNACQG